MARFLKLTTMLLNTNDIHKIMITPNKYVIHIVVSQHSYVEKLEVCETKHPIDYKMVSEWIEKTI